ncbi:MAG: hypothetical protein KC442_15045, partial [Thermomicrobiales bacterium]|nr:hypothetical protein [Thermomicrobiales bacterium]
ALATALVVTSTAYAEPIFYGGYPQQIALGLGLAGLWALAGAVDAQSHSRRARSLLVAAACFATASATHLLYGPLFVASGAFIVALAALIRRPGQRVVLLELGTLLPALVVSALLAGRALRFGYAAPLGATERALPEAWWYATRETPWLWAGCVVLGGLTASAALLGAWRGRQPDGRCAFPGAPVVGLALLIPAGVLFAASGQPRLAPPLLLAGAVLTASLCRAASDSHQAARAPLVACWGIAALWLASSTTHYARDFADFYQVLDNSLVASAARIPAGAGAVAVAADHRGWPVGWWYEALQDRPVYVGSDPVWLAFPQERDRAARVTALLSAPTAGALHQQAEDLGVAYLIVRKWDWIGWDRWLATPASDIAITFDDGETLILQLSPASP